MVGLIDIDIFKCKTFVPNPEIMLLSSYFKKQGEVVKLLGSFKDLKYYDKVYIRKNKDKSMGIPPELFNNPKIDFGGLAFTRGVYVQLPEEVLSCTPDPTIYDAFIKCKTWETKSEKTQKNSLNGQFLSLHHSNIREIDRNTVMIIDGDITEQDLDTLCNIKKKNAKQIFHFYYPIHVSKSSDIRAFVEQDWFPKNKPPYFICHSHIEPEDFELIKRAFSRRAAVIEYIPLDTTIRKKDILHLVERVVNNTLYIKERDLPISFRPNPKARTGGNMDILNLAIAWGNDFHTTQSFYEYCATKHNILSDRVMVDNFADSPILQQKKNIQRIGGKIHYEW